MDARDDFMRFLQRRLVNLSPAHQLEELLQYLVVMMKHCSRKTLLGVREELKQQINHHASFTEVIEVIDGHLALRDIQKQSTQHEENH